MKKGVNMTYLFTNCKDDDTTIKNTRKRESDLNG